MKIMSGYRLWARISGLHVVIQISMHPHHYPLCWRMMLSPVVGPQLMGHEECWRNPRDNQNSSLSGHWVHASMMTKCSDDERPDGVW